MLARARGEKEYYSISLRGLYKRTIQTQGAPAFAAFELQTKVALR